MLSPLTFMQSLCTSSFVEELNIFHCLLYQQHLCQKLSKSVTCVSKLLRNIFGDSVYLGRQTGGHTGRYLLHSYVRQCIKALIWPRVGDGACSVQLKKLGGSNRRWPTNGTELLTNGCRVVTTRQIWWRHFCIIIWYMQKVNTKMWQNISY